MEASPQTCVLLPRLWEAFPVAVDPGSTVAVGKGAGQEPRWLIVQDIYHGQVIIFLPQKMELRFRKVKGCSCRTPQPQVPGLLGLCPSFKATADTVMGSWLPCVPGESSFCSQMTSLYQALICLHNTRRVC